MALRLAASARLSFGRIGPPAFRILRPAPWLFALLLLLIQHPAATAQQPALQPASAGVLLGRVVDAETLDPLATVEVTVRTTRGERAAASALTDRSGRFLLPGLDVGRYELTFRRLGYAPAVEEVVIESDRRTVDLGSVALLPSAVVLDEVQVIGERSTVVFAPDRDIYSVEGMPGAAGGSATDVLAEVPDLEVDVNGSVSLQGSSPRIYLNGRPAPMEGEALEIFLQQFPSENIESIEVMTNPSSRYEAEGAGGIVNIVLKRDARLGLNGNTYVNAGTRGDLATGGRASYQRGPLTVQGGSSIRLTQRETRRTDLRQNLLADPITMLEQEAVSDRSTLSGSIDMTAEYALAERTTVIAESRFFRNAAESEGVTIYTEMDARELVTGMYDRFGLDDADRASTDLSLELRHMIEPRRHELTAELELSGGRESEESLIRRRMLEDWALDEDVELTLDEAREHESEVGFRTDYQRRLGELGQLEVGYRGELGETEDDRLRRFGLDGAPEETMKPQTTGFLHRQSVNSVYLTAARRMGQLNAQVGLRTEHTGTRLRLPGEADAFDNSYLSFFPSANLTYGLGEGKRIRIGYSVRMRRPSPNVLNPIDHSTDPLNRRVGDPSIRPQYTHSTTVQGSWTGSLGTLRISPFYRRTFDEWAQHKIVNEEGVSTTVWGNLATTSSYGASFNASIRDFHGFGGSVNLSGRREEREWSAVVGRSGTASTRWSLRTRLNGRITPTLNAQGSVSHNPGRDLPQGRASATTMTSIGLRQRFLDNRASANLSIRDPFGIYRSSVRTADRSHVEVGQNRISARQATLGLSYSFGSNSGGDRRRRGGRR